MRTCGILRNKFFSCCRPVPNNKVHRADMGLIWGQQDPGGPHVGPMNLAIWVYFHSVSASCDMVFLTHFGVVTPYADINQHWFKYWLVPNGTKPLLGPMSTEHQWGPVTVIWWPSGKRYLRRQLWKLAWKLFTRNFTQISQKPMS